MNCRSHSFCLFFSLGGFLDREGGGGGEGGRDVALRTDRGGGGVWLIIFI